MALHNVRAELATKDIMIQAFCQPKTAVVVAA